MKFSILLLSIILFIGCSLCSMEKSVTFKLIQTDVGYDVYSEDGELLLEFTKNSDIDEFELLEKIYKVSLIQSVNLIPTREGYEISGEDGELFLELTNKNCNKKELDLLKYIYEVSLEHREELQKKIK